MREAVDSREVERRRWWLYGVGGAVGLLALVVLTLAAVYISVRYVVLEAKVGPVPGQKVARPVDDLGSLVKSPPDASK